MDKMPRFLRSVRNMKRNSQYTDSPDITFAVQWARHLVNTVSKHSDDREFIMDVISSSSDYFKNEMNDQQKSDAFFAVLGMAASKNKRG